MSDKRAILDPYNEPLMLLPKTSVKIFLTGNIPQYKELFVKRV